MNKFQQDLHNIRKRHSILRFLGLFFITVIIWIGFSIFRSQKKVTTPPELQELAAPLDPTFDTQVLERLENKRVYTASELQEFPLYTLQAE